jgi:hypothetical protein
MTDARLGDWLLTYSGEIYWPLDPRPEEMHLEDIAHGLSLPCRYADRRDISPLIDR